MDSWNSQKMLDQCIYDYFVKKGMHETAEAFSSEANVENITHEAIGSPEEFLVDWWVGFYGVYNSNQADHAQEPYAEAPRNMDNVVPQVPYVVPASSPHSARPAHNISPVVPAFDPERLQEDEATSKLRFVEMDHPSLLAPFVTDSSYPMEQIPNMPQQWEATDEGEGRNIFFGRTMQMEPNANCPDVSMFPVPDPSEEGSCTGSCSEMQQSP